MKVTLEHHESESIFHNALCNGHGLAYCGLEITYNEEDYKNAKESLQQRGESICLEDVWMEILRRGGTLTLVDNESGEDDRTIKLHDVHERVQKTDIRHLMDAINETDDGITAEVILQMVFYGVVIFG
jgi:hypothetical protein